MTLHLLSRSPVSGSSFLDCLHSCSPEDEILLIQDAVYACASETHRALLKSRAIQCYALIADCDARGVVLPEDGAIHPVDYQDFVELTVKHPRSVTWR